MRTGMVMRHGAFCLLFFLWAPTAWGRGLSALPVAEINRIVRSGVLPYTLEELAGHLQSTIRHDRPTLRARLWRLFGAYYRYEAACRQLRLLQTQRDNLAAIHALYRQQQRRAEVDDLAALHAHNALLAVDSQLVQQRQAQRLILLEILETALLLDLTEDGRAVSKDGHAVSEEGHAAMPTGRRADARGN